MTDEQKEVLGTISTDDLIDEVGVRSTHLVIGWMNGFDDGDEPMHTGTWGGLNTAVGMIDAMRFNLQKKMNESGRGYTACDDEDEGLSFE